MGFERGGGIAHEPLVGRLLQEALERLLGAVRAGELAAVQDDAVRQSQLDGKPQIPPEGDVVGQRVPQRCLVDAVEGDAGLGVRAMGGTGPEGVAHLGEAPPDRGLVHLCRAVRRPVPCGGDVDGVQVGGIGRRAA